MLSFYEVLLFAPPLTNKSTKTRSFPAESTDNKDCPLAVHAATASAQGS